MPINTPYHEGELAVQLKANESDRAHVNSRILSTTIPAGAMHFITQQSMLIIGNIDKQGQVWSSVLFGHAGFLRVLDEHTLEIDIAHLHPAQTSPAQDDTLHNNVNENPNTGLLIIELGSRRRLRINGRAKRISAARYIINIDSAYPNCPKYIQRRHLTIDTSEITLNRASNDSSGFCNSALGKIITTAQKNLITNADTFFVASAHPERGVDASHRGGHSGFVKTVNERQLRIPDFVGNSMFNTLGNFSSYPYAGLLFIDFEHGCLLQLTGRAEVLWNRDDPQQETGDTRRYWQFDISGWREHILGFRLNWEFMDSSPHIPIAI